MLPTVITQPKRVYMRSRWLLGLCPPLHALSIPLSAYPGDEPHYSFDQVKTALANIPISQGPDASKLTRSRQVPSCTAPPWMRLC